MNINKFEDFVVLVENYKLDALNTIDANKINLSGIATFKDYIFEAEQYLNSNINSEELSPLKKRFYDAYSKLSKEDRDSMLFSTLTSYYTPEVLTKQMTSAALNYFSNNQVSTISVLEPAAGTGNLIFSLLDSNLNLTNPINLTIDAVEMDNFTATILEKNLKTVSNVKLSNTPYELFDNNKKFELIIGNIPFGQYKTYDSNYNSIKDRELINNKIHNYFFLKAANQLKPGGMLTFITSKELMDSSGDENLRKFLVENLNLVSATRFPEETFKDAKTKVLTDLLIFQKPLEPKNKLSSNEELFLRTSLLEMEGISQSLNSYYSENPNNVLGTYYPTTGFKGKMILSIKENATLENIQDILINNLKQNAIKDLHFEQNLEQNEKQFIEATNLDRKIKENYPFIEVGNIVLFDNNFHHIIVHEDFNKLLDLKKIDIPVKDRERTLNLIELRDIYKDFRNSLREENPNAAILQAELNNKYDTFSFFYNSINSRENKTILFLDSENQLIKSLEREITPGEFQKSDIFSKSAFLSKNNSPVIESVKDAIYLSFNKYGTVNEDYITDIYNKKREDWINEALSNKILFINPILSEDNLSILNYELSLESRFLSGYIEGKIQIYNKIINQKDESLKKYKEFLNRGIIDAAKSELVKNIPYKLSIQEIDPSLGEPWINHKIFELFGAEHLKDPSFKINYKKDFDSYTVYSQSSIFGAATYSISGKSKNVNYKDVFKYALMQNLPEFTIKTIVNGKEKKVSDKELNTSVQVAVEKLQKAFSEWLMTKHEISEHLEDRYHILNNAIVKEKYNPELLKFDTLNGYTPYKHQISVALEQSMNNGGIIDHKVGYGKTLSMAMLTMTKKKFGINKKELVVGLNANYVDIYTAFKTAYPEGKFLLIEEGDMTDSKKMNTLYKIANNNWDAVITSHSSLLKFPRSPYTEKEVINQIINDVKMTIEENENSKLLSRGEMNNLLKKLKNAEEEQKIINHILNERKETGSLIFEDLGFDGLVLDESHYFKNLEFSTKHTRIAGLGSNKKTQKTRNLLSYIRSIQNKNKGVGKYGGVTFATGTTISNSISELYSLFKYLIPKELELKSMNTFDQWARVYARKTYEYEESVSGNIKLKERFRYFVKVPELSSMYYNMTNFADEKVFKVDSPELDYKMTLIEPHKELKDYLESIKEFGTTKDVKKLPFYTGVGDAKKAVGLICTNLGRKASLSLKLINRNLKDSPDDKINVACNKIIEYHQKYDFEKGTQLFFCDQGVPGNKKDFDIYNYTKRILINKGIPAHEIAFIHSYDNKRQQLYNKVNSGEIRIVLGSTQKMGVGVNMQEKLIALHHLDLPWRPSDLEQRNGRGGRPGNKLLPKYDNKMDVFFYATKGTLDSYSFNILQIKQNFISQIKNASIHTRKIDEGAFDSDGGMNFQEYMAACSSNQYLTEKLKVEKTLQRLYDEKASFDVRDKQNKIRLNHINTDVTKITEAKLKVEKDLNLTKGFNPLIIDRKIIEDQKRISVILNLKLENLIINEKPGIIANLDKGCFLSMEARDKSDPISHNNYCVYLRTPSENKIGYKSKTFTKNTEEVFSYSTNCLNRLNTIIQDQESTLNNYKVQKDTINLALETKFSKQHLIDECKSKIQDLVVLIEVENKKNSGISTPDPEEKKKGRGFKR